MTGVKSYRDTLIAGYKAGIFLKTVEECSSPDHNERHELAMELAALHNEGLIDVVVAFEKLENNIPDGPDFFLTRHVFEEALPHLNASVSSVMRCVLRLYRGAGQDLAAGTIFEGFTEFCAKYPSRSAEGLKEIEANPNLLVDMLPSTIAAGSQIDNPHYVAQISRLSQSQDIEIRRRAVFSFSSLKWPEGANVPDYAFATLEDSVAKETDDQILGSIVKSAFALFKQDKSQEPRIITLIASALQKGGEHTLYAASALFGFHTKDLPQQLLDLLLDHLKRVSPEHKGTLDNVDYGLSYLLKNREPEKAIQFLQESLLAHPGKLTLGTFDSATRDIRESAALRSKVLTRWFLFGERALCEAVHEIGGTHYGDELHAEIDPAELQPLDFVHVIFVARKAIGYFFMRPVTASSVLISLMRLAPNDHVLDELRRLLWDTLLMNYPGNVHQYVVNEIARESGKVKETLEKALASFEEYHQTLRTVPNLPALHPTQAQRESYRRHMSDSMAESMSAAEKKSVFYGLFTRSTLLYGRKSINYIYGGGDKPKRLEVPLTSHSVQMEFPRTEHIDPYGLDHMLRVFRLERLRK